MCVYVVLCIVPLSTKASLLSCICTLEPLCKTYLKQAFLNTMRLKGGCLWQAELGQGAIDSAKRASVQFHFYLAMFVSVTVLKM